MTYYLELLKKEPTKEINITRPKDCQMLITGNVNRLTKTAFHSNIRTQAARKLKPTIKVRNKTPRPTKDTMSSTTEFFKNFLDMDFFVIYFYIVALPPEKCQISTVIF